ncbi:MAG: biopolymer transporter ExbD [Candidatus Omnitrophica bacterium]|nr:biopolymer transporter ExbD [Candidatus Omnitrophota bacterium]MBU4141141.1 biopolymer transporter ExbD [Candidatus Omnitrophota bacterium]
MRFKRHLEFEKGQLDIAPLIDVVFLLLIFFMLTSSFIFQPGIKINLPKAVTSEVIHEENLVITINAEGLIYLNNRPVALKQLKSHLKKASAENHPLLIKADRRASLGKVVEVWDMSREAGLTQINIATDQPAQ